MNINKIVSLLIFVAFLIMLDQYVGFGIWWSWDQFLHHENFAAILIAFSGGLFAFTYLRRRKIL